MIHDLPNIMLVDMNSFFASVEQQADLKYRNRPLGVCASMHKTSCLIAASKEAKVLGIKTGTLIYMAKKICPDIILIHAEPEKYREVNRRLVKIFSDYTDRLEVYSIDEAFLGSERKPTQPSFDWRRNQATDQNRGRGMAHLLGWRCSHKFMAKLAADLQKPDGLSIVWRSNLPEIYKHKKFTDLWGIARGWQNRLASLGITSPLQMLSYSVANLLAVFGKPGFYIWRRVNGLEVDEFRTADDEFNNPKSFGHSWVLNFRTTNKKKLAPVIMRLQNVRGACVNLVFAPLGSI